MHVAHRNDDSVRVAGLRETRRGVLRRSFLGIAGIGLTGALAACGGDEGDDEETTGGQGADEGAEDPDEEPGIEEETGIGDDSEGTAEGEEEGLEEDPD